ncbi:flagellar hook-basal body complex protein [Trinickia fusca]|uniref:Flagellar hook-basal body complex protein n=1 Tax=Trinickia fusca TaxID=2419777 RepID=A0A494XEW2_9BURK|nr:flagellar hook-basal body complex protein [Trinickia fusca]RKP48422.1 flagellar hook-basal body complex protein [Trinickia fusca]
MLDSIFIAMSGLTGYEKGLRVISNDTANLNTPGYKGASLQFADMFYSSGNLAGGSGGQYGYGLTTLGTRLDLKQGDLQNTGNDLDAAVDGQGLFLLRDGAGNVHGSRAGQFKFDNTGTLVSSATGETVLGLDGSGNLVPIQLGALKVSAAKASTRLTFSGNLSSTTTTQTVSGLTVIDKTGSSHSLSARFDAVSGSPGNWTVTVLDGANTVGTGKLAFISSQPDPANNSVTINYTPSGGQAMPLTLDFSSNVTSYDSGSQSSLAVASQDGYGAGAMTRATFDPSGTLALTYSNGQSAKGQSLALGAYTSQDALQPVNGNEFAMAPGQTWQIGAAGTQAFGKVKAGMIEISNVDLSAEFSNLVIMQRGYQASSQVVSTANDMLAQLFQMQSK